jgi:hypothetical protein
MGERPWGKLHMLIAHTVARGEKVESGMDMRFLL